MRYFVQLENRTKRVNESVVEGQTDTGSIPVTSTVNESLHFFGGFLFLDK